MVLGTLFAASPAAVVALVLIAVLRHRRLRARDEAEHVREMMELALARYAMDLTNDPQIFTRLAQLRSASRRSYFAYKPRTAASPDNVLIEPRDSG